MTTWNTNNLLGGTPQALSSTFKSIIALFGTSGALQRAYLSEFALAASDVPNATDCPIVMDVSLMTADGTGTSVTPNASGVLETGTMAAPRSTSKANYTVEPTITSNSSRLARAMNQRASMRWVAFCDDARLVSAAVANSGWALRARSPNYASTVVGELVFSE